MNFIFPANKQQFLKLESTDVQSRKFQGTVSRDGQRMTFCYSLGLQMRDCNPSADWHFIKLTDDSLTHPWWNIICLLFKHNLHENILWSTVLVYLHCVPTNQRPMRYWWQNQTTISFYVSLLGIHNTWIY